MFNLIFKVMKNVNQFHYRKKEISVICKNGMVACASFHYCNSKDLKNRIRFDRRLMIRYLRQYYFLPWKRYSYKQILAMYFPIHNADLLRRRSFYRSVIMPNIK